VSPHPSPATTALRVASVGDGRDASAPAARDTSRGDHPDTSGQARADASPPGLPYSSGVATRDASGAAGETRRLCAWCELPISPGTRRDAVCCSVRCRQARHRFTRAAGQADTASGGQPMRLAYADPPYPGNSRLYQGHPDYAGEVDHAELITRLADYDGWALSTSAAALPAVLTLCPPGVRVAAWHKGERPARSRWPLSAWEPVIYCGGRPADPSRTSPSRRVDSLVHGVAPMTTLPGRVIGAKPAAFCRWVFGLLGAAPGDSLDDLFPGSGAVTRAWAAYTRSAEPSPPVLADASPSARRDGSSRLAARPASPNQGAAA